MTFDIFAPRLSAFELLVIVIVGTILLPLLVECPYPVKLALAATAGGVARLLNILAQRWIESA